MKTILVPTDFSEAAKNAAEYAVELAKKTKSKIILFHAYYLPIVPEDMPLFVPTEAIEIEKVNNELLENEASRLRNNNQVLIDCKIRLGFAHDEIVILAKEYQPELIIMGMKGLGFIDEHLIGSTATAVMRDVHVPVLIIPDKARYINPSKIAFAFDYNKETENLTLAPLKNFAKEFNAEILITNVLHQEEVIINVEKGIAGMQLENYFRETNHSFHFIENNNITAGMNEFINKHEIDMLAMVPHKHTLLERLFKKSNTRKMAFHTHIPLLILPENE